MLPRCLIALALIWAVLLGAPALRGQSLRMSHSVPDLGGPGVFQERSSAFELTGAQIETLANQHPGDGVLALEALRARTTKYEPDYWARFDALIAQMPDDLTLRRARMIDATMARLPLPFYAPDYNSSAQTGALPTQADRDKLLQWQSRAQRARLAQMAREGARQAPGDGFFPWMEAMALWDRDEEPALRALERAANCADFNDGTLDYQLARLKWAQTQRPLDWDQKFALMNEVLLPHYSVMRVLQRELTWSGLARYRRGDKAGAYRRWTLALRAAGAFRRAQLRGNRSFYVGVLVSESMEKTVWSAVARELQSNPPKGAKKLDEAIAFARFVALARRDGQGALAALATRERAEIKANTLTSDVIFTLYPRAFGLDATATRLQLQLPWLGRNIFWLSIAGALALALCLPVRWLERRLRRPYLGRVSWRQIALLGALWLAALGASAWFRTGPELLMLTGTEHDEPLVAAGWEGLVGLFDTPWSFWSAVAATITLAFALALAERRFAERRVGQVEIWVWLPGLLWLGASALTLALFLLDAASLEWMVLWVGWLVFGALALSLTVYAAERGAVAPPFRWRRRLAMASVVSALFGVGAYLQFDGVGDWPAFLIVASSALWCAGLLLYLALCDAPTRLASLRALGVAFKTLGAIALLCSVALLLASLLALPIRARQNATVDDYFARGEIGWWQTQPLAQPLARKTNAKAR